MGEDVRIVKVEIINKVWIAQRLDEKQFIVGGPIGARDDDAGADRLV